MSGRYTPPKNDRCRSWTNLTGKHVMTSRITDQRGTRQVCSHCGLGLGGKRRRVVPRGSRTWTDMTPEEAKTALALLEEMSVT